ncbi:37046_t:CDS:2, partial [Racocetra persica]
MPDSLKVFNDKTQESIVQWFKTVKANFSVSEIDEIDDDYYIDPMFPGIRPISDNLMTGGGIAASNPSESIFCVVDIPL